MALRKAEDMRPRGACAGPQEVKKPRHITGPQWPSFVGTATLVGTSGPVTVYVDARLGAQAKQNATDLLATAPTIASFNDSLFGSKGGPTNVIVFALGGVTNGDGGADHMGCDYTTGNDIEVDASYGQSIRVQALFEAELSECSMGGNLCGVSTGEALSRWCAAWMTNNALADFETATAWVADGMANWVDQVYQSDQDADSIGCGMVFLSWLMSLGHPLSVIAPAMVTLGDTGTLAGLYAHLTGGKTSAWADFQAAVTALPGGATGIVSDDPFNALASVPAPIPVPTPAPTPTPVPVPTPVPAPQPPPVPPPSNVPLTALETIVSWYDGQNPRQFRRNVRQAFATVESWLETQ